AIVPQFGHAGAYDVEGAGNTCAGLEWQTEVEHLRGAEEFNGDDLARLLQNTQHFVGAGGSHAVEVFHARARWDGVDAGGMRQHFDLVGERGRDILDDHKAGVEAGIGGQEKWGAVFVPIVGSHEIVDTTLGEAGKLGDTYGHCVQRQGQGLTVKVAADQYVPVLGKDQGIVG